MQSTVENELFNHTYFGNNALIDFSGDQALHIYIEGDGTPWIDGRWIAEDPTPRKPVMLNLMNLDPSPSVLLGRPCYHQNTKESNCQKENWTSGRYSSKIVASMVLAIKSLQQQFKFKEIVLFGHSGGGALAMLMAQLLAQEQLNVIALITLGTNIDTDAWTASRGFLPLEKSLNPAHLPRSGTPPAFTLHLFGQDDTVVNFNLFKEYLSKLSNAEYIVYKDLDHTCCWQTIWPKILNRVQSIQNSHLKPPVRE